MPSEFSKLIEQYHGQKYKFSKPSGSEPNLSKYINLFLTQSESSSVFKPNYGATYSDQSVMRRLINVGLKIHAMFGSPEAFKELSQNDQRLFKFCVQQYQKKHPTGQGKRLDDLKALLEKPKEKRKDYFNSLSEYKQQRLGSLLVSVKGMQSSEDYQTEQAVASSKSLCSTFGIKDNAFSLGNRASLLKAEISKGASRLQKEIGKGLKSISSFTKHVKSGFAQASKDNQGNKEQSVEMTDMSNDEQKPKTP